MKTFNILTLPCLAGAQICRADYHTNTITTPGGSYAFSVDGSEPINPTIQLVAG